MTTPSTPPSRNHPMDNLVQPVIPSGPPPPLSLADTRLKTLRLLLQGYSSLSVPTLLQSLSPQFTHEVLPQSLGMPVRGKEDFAHHAAMVFSAFKSFEMKPTELWEDPDKGEVILRCAMEGVLKNKEGPEGEKEESGAEGDGKVEVEAKKKKVTPFVDVEDESNPDEDPELEPVDLSNILGDLPELPDRPATVLSPITEVTEPSQLSPPSSLDLSFNPSSQEEPTSSPPTSEDSPRSSPPAPEEPLEEDPKTSPSTNTEIHWNNECLLIISFTPCGSQISKIQEFVDSAKAVEMKKKHAPKGFDEASAPPPPTYKPATYLNLDTLKLKDGSGTLTNVTVTELPPSGVQCGMDSLQDTLDTFSTTTEYPSPEGQNSFCLDRVGGWHSTEGADGAAYEAKFEAEVEAEVDPNVICLAKSESRKIKRLRFAKNGSGSGGGSESGHFHSSSGFWASASGDPVDVDHHEHDESREKKGLGWSSTIADTIEVINHFVPPLLVPVHFVDGNTTSRHVAVKKEWVSGATFVAGFALGKLWFGGGRGGRSWSG
ncbi:hypothetical protein B0H65DRAFT_558596 [Neurospora tetraspora]|uniref:Uncharacterized protein n=1 Tax=Neurospora tetraspora TaxID=94610 RepID=A0AAE0MQ02_9PEZI|nr:hypothetical protein B0H65DRAFT_558596 [Neurospora tetraspora]